MEGEQQALVQVNAQTDSQRLEACKRRFDEAGKNLDEAWNALNEARNTLAQWKDHHSDFDPRDPVLRLLEQREKNAIQVLKDMNQLQKDAIQAMKDMNQIVNDSEQRLKEAQRGSNVWIDTGKPFPLSKSLLSVLMTNA